LAILVSESASGGRGESAKVHTLAVGDFPCAIDTRQAWGHANRLGSSRDFNTSHMANRARCTPAWRLLVKCGWCTATRVRIASLYIVDGEQTARVAPNHRPRLVSRGCFMYVI